MSKITAHYKDVVSHYDRQYQMLFGEQRKDNIRYIIDHFLKDAMTRQVICDIGGGTGTTLEMLKMQLGPTHTYILVEPSAEMVTQAKMRKIPPDQIFQLSAEDFVKDQQFVGTIDLILCQFMIHHVKELAAFFKGVNLLLKEGGHLLIITRPLEVEFPFGKHAKGAWKQSYSFPPSDFISLLQQLNFQTSEEILTFSLTIDKSSWMEMVGDQPLFSNLALLTIQQRAEDLNEIATKEEVLHFNDHLIMITATKK